MQYYLMLATFLMVFRSWLLFRLLSSNTSAMFEPASGIPMLFLYLVPLFFPLYIMYGVRRYDPGRENHEFDPTLGDFFLCVCIGLVGTNSQILIP